MVEKNENRQFDILHCSLELLSRVYRNKTELGSDRKVTGETIDCLKIFKKASLEKINLLKAYLNFEIKFAIYSGYH